MGISGLLPFLKKASRPVHVRELSHSVVAVDVYGWLHKGAFGCAEKLVTGQPTNGYILYVMKYVDLLLAHDIKPILVFDGRNLPSKAATEKKRRENRDKYRKMAKDYLREGKNREARECFQRCIDITPAMARDVIRACQERNVDCIVAPYEADAQLAFLNLAGLAHYVISEDSDLTLFGCEKIVFKLDSNGNGVLYEKEKIGDCLGHRADTFNFDKFRYMCITSGCDYLASLHGIGLAKAQKFWSKVSNPNLRQVLPKIPTYLNMHQITVTQEYVDGFVRANNTFLYQLVFDPREKKLRPLNEYSDTESPSTLEFAGSYVDDQLAEQMALGNIDLHSLKSVDSFDPQSLRQWDESAKSSYGKRSNHKTIWAPDFDKATAVPRRAEKVDTREETAFGTFARSAEVKRKRARESSPEKSPVLMGSSKKRREEPCAQAAADPDASSIESLATQYQVSASIATQKSPPKKYVSKYFNLNTNKVKTPAKRKSNEGGSWFQDLEIETSHKGKFIYNTDDLRNQEETDDEPLRSAKKPTKEKEKPRFGKIESLETNLSIRTAPSARKAFKPVMVNSQEEAKKSSDDEEAKRLSRNPFAKVKSPPKDKENPLSQTSSQGTELPSSQLSGFSIDNDSFRFTPKVISSQETLGSEGSSVFVRSQDSEVSSSYFSQKSIGPSNPSSQISARPPKGMSGLLRPKKVQQRSLLDMWKKK